MNGSTISIFSNKIFFEIIKEIKLFSKYKINHYDDSALCIKNGKKENQRIRASSSEVHARPNGVHTQINELHAQRNEVHIQKQ